MLIKAQTLGKGWKGGSHTEDTQTHQWNVCLECVCEIVLCCQPFCGSSEKEPQRMLLLVCRCCRCCFCLQINLITWIMPLKIIHKNPKSRGILANGSTAAAETTKKFNYWVQPSTQTGSKRTLPYTVNYRRSMIPVKSALEQCHWHPHHHLLISQPLTLNTAEVKKTGSRMNTTPERTICRLSSATGSIFQGIKEHPAKVNIYYSIFK